jgi:hypothetical protein
MSSKRYTQEQQAQAVAEFWLAGSYRYVGRMLNMDGKTVALWVGHAEAPRTSAHKKMRARAEELYERRKGALDRAIQLTLDLQIRDLPEADFRDRTGFLKIAAELRLRERGKPTSIVQSKAELDAEIDRLLHELAER